MYFIIAFQIYFILVVYSYFESLREDPSGSIAGFDQGRGTVMVCYSSMPLCPMYTFIIKYNFFSFSASFIVSTSMVNALLFSPHYSLLSLQISLSILFLNLSVWPLKWKKWVLTWVWSYFWWSHKNGFHVFFLSGRCKWEVLQLTQSFEPRKLSSGEKTKLFTVASISIRSPRPSTY